MRRRTNMLAPRAEAWRPPLLSPSRARFGRFTGALRRFLDIQNGSIWRDLSYELRDARGTVLDVGCGAQPYRPLLPARVAYRGIDTTDAEARFGYAQPDTVYYSGDHWPIEDGSVDVVLCTETLEHVADPTPFLAEAARCLKAPARLVLTVPFAARWHFIPHDYWRFTPSSLDRLLRRAGFTDVAVYARGNAVTVACYKSMALVLPLLFPRGRRLIPSLLSRLAGLLLSPFLFLVATVANLSLLFDGGDDCLGYTVLATKAAPSTPC